jgi:hypothetical protein
MSNARKSTVPFKSAAEQCAEYVAKERLKERRREADASIVAHVEQMRRQFGVGLTLGAVIRYVGLLILEADSKPLRECRRFLAKCIAISVMRGLTRARLLH